MSDAQRIQIIIAVLIRLIRLVYGPHESLPGHVLIDELEEIRTP